MSIRLDLATVERADAIAAARLAADPVSRATRATVLRSAMLIGLDALDRADTPKGGK